MSKLTDMVHLEIPGFMPVVEIDGREWCVVRTSDRVVVQTGLGSEQEARERAGTLSIRLRVEEIVKAAIYTVANKAVSAFESTPHTAEYSRHVLEIDVRGDIVHCLEKELPKWMHEFFEGIEAMRNANKKLKEVGSSVEARAQEKERDDGIN